MSVVGYDIRGREVREINIGFKDERIRLVFLRIPGQFTIHHQAQWLPAVRALALNLDRQLLVT